MMNNNCISREGKKKRKKKTKTKDHQNILLLFQSVISNNHQYQLVRLWIKIKKVTRTIKLTLIIKILLKKKISKNLKSIKIIKSRREIYQLSKF